MATGADDAAAVGFIYKYLGAIIATIASALVGILSWMFGRIVKKHDEEIASIKGSLKALEANMNEINQKLPEDCTPLERFEAMEERTRQSIIALHGKIETGTRDLGNKIDTGHREIMSILTRRRT